mgnify:CR=1 FL=1
MSVPKWLLFVIGMAACLEGYWPVAFIVVACDIAFNEEKLT